jgi:hypothetical protein
MKQLGKNGNCSAYEWRCPIAIKILMLLGSVAKATSNKSSARLRSSNDCCPFLPFERSMRVSASANSDILQSYLYKVVIMHSNSTLVTFSDPATPPELCCAMTSAVAEHSIHYSWVRLTSLHPQSRLKTRPDDKRLDFSHCSFGSCPLCSFVH